MSKYFNLLELCHSNTADINHIDNTPNEENGNIAMICAVRTMTQASPLQWRKLWW